MPEGDPRALRMATVLRCKSEVNSPNVPMWRATTRAADATTLELTFQRQAELNLPRVQSFDQPTIGRQFRRTRGVERADAERVGVIGEIENVGR